MNYQETIEYLFQQLPMFQRVGPKAFKKDLDNIRLLLEYLERPHESFSSIHIAGTNGKGSVSHFLASIFQTAGYKTGLYTSPHYRDFRERIRVDGQFIKEEAVVTFVERIKTLIPQINPSFFEITVAMAFEYFRTSGVEMAIVETGLGGRLDSTNVLIPKLSIITNISYDHQGFLGDTLEAIAGEKAGIIKTGIPTLIGETQKEIAHVFELKAAECVAPLYFADEWVGLQEIHEDGSQKEFAYINKMSRESIQAKTSLESPFLPKNLLTVIAAMSVWNHSYREHEVDIHDIEMGITQMPEHTRYIGRWQQISVDPLVIADSAHNEAGLKTILEKLDTLFGYNIHFVIGFVFDKDWKKLLRMFPQRGMYYFAKAEIPRGLDAKELLEEAKKLGLRGNSYSSIQEALSAAKTACKNDEIIFVGGSTFTVAEVV